MNLHRWLAGALVVALLLILVVNPALAGGKMKIKGIIKEFDLKAKTLTITADGKEMSFFIQSERALAKLDIRLFPGDEVKIKYVVLDERNIIGDTNDLKGTKPGC